MTLEEQVQLLESKVLALEFEVRSLRREEERRDKLEKLEEIRHDIEWRSKLGLSIRFPEIKINYNDI